MTIKLLIMTKITDKNTDITLEDPEIIRSAAISKALGHPARIAILKILAQQKTCFCGDITGIIPLAQSTVSQHLKVLRNRGLCQWKDRKSTRLNSSHVAISYA